MCIMLNTVPAYVKNTTICIITIRLACNYFTLESVDEWYIREYCCKSVVRACVCVRALVLAGCVFAVCLLCVCACMYV